MSKFKIKETYLLLLIVLGLVSLAVYTTFALFTASTTINDVVGITATLDIGKSLTEYEIVTVSPNETKLIELNVVNSYNGNIYYGAWYQIIRGNSDDIDIGIYTEKNPNSSSGVLSSNSNINLLAGVTNNSESTITLYIGVKGSTTNDLNLGNNKILLSDGFSEGYSVTLNITNGTVSGNSNTLKVKEGDDAIFNITPNTNYGLEIDSQTCNGVLNSNTGNYTISNITEDKNCSITLKEKVIKDGSLAEHIITTYTSNNSISTRSDFSSTFSESNDKIYTTNKTEDGSTVYYYAGNTTHNWVKFGKYTSDWYSCAYVYSDGTKYTMGASCSYDYNADSYTTTKLASKNDDIYWRIIRTNEDGSVRLLYLGNAIDTTKGYIGFSRYGSDSILNLGYMYGTLGSLSNNRTNKNNSTIKNSIDSWYKKHIFSSVYNNYVSKTAIYCNDRSISSGGYSEDKEDTTYFAPAARNLNRESPSYKCGANVDGSLFESTQAIEDKFSTSATNGGNGKLTYPVALMTVDEVAFAGGVYYSNLSSPYAWYYSNSAGGSSTLTSWWTMSPRFSTSVNRVFIIESSGGGYEVYGKISDTNLNYFKAIRPVLSLKACVKYSSGDGSPTNPYQVTIDEACINQEN